jgi:hypothetical protein
MTDSLTAEHAEEAHFEKIKAAAARKKAAEARARPNSSNAELARLDNGEAAGYERAAARHEAYAKHFSEAPSMLAYHTDNEGQKRIFNRKDTLYSRSQNAGRVQKLDNETNEPVD